MPETPTTSTTPPLDSFTGAGTTIGLYFGPAGAVFGAAAGAVVDVAIALWSKFGTGSFGATQHLSWNEANEVAMKTADSLKLVLFQFYGENLKQIGLEYAKSVKSTIEYFEQKGTTWESGTIKTDLQKFINNPNQIITYGYISTPIWYATIHVALNYDVKRQDDFIQQLDFWVFKRISDSAVKLGFKPMLDQNAIAPPNKNTNTNWSIWDIFFPKKDYSQFQNPPASTTPQQSGFDLKTILPIALLGISMWYFTKGKK